LKKDADGLVLEQKIESIKATSPGGAGKPSTHLLHQLEGATFRFTCDPRLRVTRLEGYEEFLNKIARDDAQVGKMARLLIPEASLRQPTEQLFAFQPDKPVRPGDSWQTQATVPFGPLGSLTAVQTW